MPIARPRATRERGCPRLSARGALAAAPASIPDAAARILPVIAVDPEVYTLDCMLARQTLYFYFSSAGEFLRGSGSGAARSLLGGHHRKWAASRHICEN